MVEASDYSACANVSSNHRCSWHGPPPFFSLSVYKFIFNKISLFRLVTHDHLGWTIRTWRRVHWSDESRFLLCPTDGRARVWRQRNTSFQDNHILGTTAFGGGGVTVCGWFSFDCKLVSGDIAGHGIVWTASCCKKCCTIWALCGLALLSMNIGLSANAWLSKWGIKRGASTLSRYFWKSS
jgi:hypothetical protein